MLTGDHLPVLPLLYLNSDPSPQARSDTPTQPFNAPLWPEMHRRLLVKGWRIVALTRFLHFCEAVGAENSETTFSPLLHHFCVVFSAEAQQQTDIQRGDSRFQFSNITPRSHRPLT